MSVNRSRMCLRWRWVLALVLAGLPAWAILYKPFRLDQLLSAVERIVQAPPAAPQT